MVEYIYFVKCPSCEDEHFSFFNEARDFALGCLTKKPIITQIEITRNDFGECVDSCDLGTVWSWEEALGKDIEEADKGLTTFSKAETFGISDIDGEFNDDSDELCEAEEATEDLGIGAGLAIAGAAIGGGMIGSKLLDSKQSKSGSDSLDELFDANIDLSLDGGDNNDVSILSSYDAENDGKEKLDELLDANISLGLDGGTGNNVSVLSPLGGLGETCSRKPTSEGMTIEQLVEMMEENEDMVECKWCNELYPKGDCNKDKDLGWLCDRCQRAIASREGFEIFDFVEEDLDTEIKDDDMTPDLDNEYDGNYPKLEESTIKYTLPELVKDSLNHLMGDLGKDPAAEDFVDDVIADIERNYDIEIPLEPIRYRNWCSAVSAEVAKQLDDTISDEAFLDEYDRDEASEDLNSHLMPCPECGEIAFDIETGVCIKCGFR